MYANDAFCIINCTADSIHCRIFATNGKRRVLLMLSSSFPDLEFPKIAIPNLKLKFQIQITSQHCHCHCVTSMSVSR